MRLRPLLLIVLLCLALPASAPQAIDDADADAAAREEDERATTVEARQSALKTLLDEAGRLRDGGRHAEAARALNRAGRLQTRLSLLRDAVATHHEALKLLGQSPDPRVQIDALNGLGQAHTVLSECPEAQEFLRQAVALSERHDYPAGKAEALLILSDCQNFGDHALALKTAQEGLALWRSVGDKRGTAAAHAAVGQYQLAQNNLVGAAESQEAALSLWRELGVADEQAEALINLGYIEYRKGAWHNVLTYLTQAQALLDDEKAEPYKMGQIMAGLADAFIETGLPEIGLEKYRLALEYYRRTKNPRAVMVMVWGIGKTQYFLGDYPAALETLRGVLRDAEAIREHTVEAMCNDYLGRTFAAMNDPGSALRHFEVSLELYTRAGNPMEAARVRALMGRVYQQQARHDKAAEYYRRALEDFRALSDQVNQSATLYALGSLALEQNDLGAAEDYLRQSISVTENMRRVSTSRDLTAAFSASVHERYVAYVECLMRRHRLEPGRGLDARAFETAELARARSLAELLQATETNLAPGLDPELAGREKSLRQALRVREDYKVALLGRAYKKEELDALEAELALLDADYKDVLATIRARYPSYERIARPVAWDLRRIQAEVVGDDQTVLLAYSLGPDRSYVWAVTRDHFKSYELPPQSPINEAAQKVYKWLMTPPAAGPGDASTPAVEELSRLILSPVAAELNKQRIVVVADGSLNYIPFQVLTGPAAGGGHLVERYEIVNTPSASILGELRQEAARRRPAAKTLAAFGDPVFQTSYARREDAGGGTQLASLVTPENERWRHALRDIELNGDSPELSSVEPLFYARLELANLRQVTAGEETFVAADFDATRERLRSTNLSEYAILHFATHGFLDPIRPENSGLLLSTVTRDGRAVEGFVGLHEIYSLHAPVELVVLSACRTALGKEVRGEGLVGLTRGFMYAGASSVLASLWKVDDEATSELMKRFYGNLLQGGMTPAEALRAAQNSIRREPQWSSPYYWAGFTLQGEYRRVIKPARASSAYTTAMTAAALGLLTAAAVWLFRRRRAARYSASKK